MRLNYELASQSHDIMRKKEFTQHILLTNWPVGTGEQGGKYDN